MKLIEEGDGKYGGDRASKAVRQWNQRTTEGRKAKGKWIGKRWPGLGSWHFKAGGGPVTPSPSSASPAISLGFTILLLLLHPRLYLWDLPFFFFCIPGYISGVYHSSSSSSASPSYISGVYHSSSSSSSAISLGFTILLLLHSPAISLGFTILLLLLLHPPAISLGFTILLLLHPRLYLWDLPFFFFCIPRLYLWDLPFFFFCIPGYISGVYHSSSSSSAFLSYISGVHHSSSSSSAFPSYISGVHHSSSSSSASPAISLGFTNLLLLLCSQPYLWGSPIFFFFCVPSHISGVHQSSSSSVFPAISLGFTNLLLLLCSQPYLWGSPIFFFFCVPSCISGVHHFG